MNLLPLVRWTLTNRLALVMGLLTLLVGGGAGATAYLQMRRQMEAQINGALYHGASLLAVRIEQRLDAVLHTFTTLAANPLISNALVDTQGRDRYLAPFLAGFTFVDGIRSGLGVADFQGRPYTAGSNALQWPDAAWLAETIGDNLPRSRCIGGDGGPRLLLAAPIVYANTGTAEGALVAQFDPQALLIPKDWSNHLSDLLFTTKPPTLELKVELPGCDSIHLGAPASGDADMLAAAAVAIPTGFRGLAVDLRLHADRSRISGIFDTLGRYYLLFTLILVPLVWLASRAVSRALTLPLRTLQSSALGIAVQGGFCERLPVTGDDEASDLGKSFNRVLERLESTHRALAESQDRLTEQIAATPLGVIEFDPHFRIRAWNPAAARLFGYGAADVEGEPVAALLMPPEQHSAWKALEQRLAAGDIPHSILLSAHNRAGEEVECEWHFFRINASQGEEFRFGALVQDLQLRRQAERAEAANRAKSAFLANMSHELRTPLNAMLGHAQILARDNLLGEGQHHSVEIILRAGDHLLNLINDVLDLAKIEAGRFELLPTPCHLPALLRGIEELFRQRAGEKQLAFHCRLPPDLPRRVEVDEKRLRQILMNLLGNAVKFTQQGEVRLEVALLPEQRQWQQAGAPGRAALEITVADTGPGIPPEQIDRLFLPFAQEGSAEYRAQGTGLGLATSLNLARQMGGDLRAACPPEGGSRFTLSLSLPTLSHGDEVMEPLVETPLPSGYRRIDGGVAPFRILVADDMADNRAVLLGLLEPLGFAVAEADDGVTAVMMAAEEPPDLVLMDLVMPGVNGLEATVRLHALPGLERLPVVACSASAFPEDRANSAAAGCVGHLAKPVRSGELQTMLAGCLPLAWVYGKGQVDDPAAPTGHGLDEETVQALRELLVRGNIAAVRRRLAAVEGVATPRLEALRQAAERFDVKTVRRLLEAS